MNWIGIRILLSYLVAVDICRAFTVYPLSDVRFRVQDHNIHSRVNVGPFCNSLERARILKSRQKNVFWMLRKSDSTSQVVRFRNWFESKRSRLLCMIVSVLIATGSLTSRAMAIENSASHRYVPNASRTILPNDDDIVFDDDASFTVDHCKESVVNYYITEDMDNKMHRDNTNKIRPERTLENCDSKIVSDVESRPNTLGSENNDLPNQEVLVLNDQMFKNGIKNVIFFGSGMTTLLILREKSKRSTQNICQCSDTYTKNQQQLKKAMMNNIEDSPSVNANPSSTKPLSSVVNPKYLERRKQPKSASEEEILAARYSAILSLEDRAYQILIDLGMIG